MKRFKINLSVMAIVLGLASAFAFTAPAPRHFDSLWKYSGSGDPTNPLNYAPTGGVPCSGTTKICMIEAPANGNHPVISTDLADRITDLDPGSGDVFLKN